MSWIDDVRQRRANLEAKRKAEDAKRATERAEEWQQITTRWMNSFASDIKALLPDGVTIVDVFLDQTPYYGQVPDIEYALNPRRDHRVVRIDLGVGVRFDVRGVTQSFTHGYTFYKSVYTIIQIYKAGSPYTEENVLVSWNRRGEFNGVEYDRGPRRKIQFSDCLFDALQKHNLRSG